MEFSNLIDRDDKETFTKPNNPDMPISSRRYLFVYEHVVKYLVFAWKGADFYGLMGINTKYFTTKESGKFLLRYRLSETVIASLREHELCKGLKRDCKSGSSN